MSDETTPFIKNNRDSNYHRVSGRNISALLNPRPLSLIGASDGQSTGFATVAWTTPISHNPSMVAISLRAGSHTCGLLRESGCFSINVLDATLQDAALYCGSTTGHRADKSAEVAHRLVGHTPFAGTSEYTTGNASTSEANDTSANDPARHILQEASSAEQMQAPCAVSAAPFEQPDQLNRHNVLLPFVEGALSFLDCEVESIQEKGDHLLICAYVTEAITQCPEDDRGRTLSTDPLLCVQTDIFATIAPANTEPL